MPDHRLCGPELPACTDHSARTTAARLVCLRQRLPQRDEKQAAHALRHPLPDLRPTLRPYVLRHGSPAGTLLGGAMRTGLDRTPHTACRTGMRKCLFPRRTAAQPACRQLRQPHTLAMRGVPTLHRCLSHKGYQHTERAGRAALPELSYNRKPWGDSGNIRLKALSLLLRMRPMSESMSAPESFSCHHRTGFRPETGTARHDLAQLDGTG